MTSSANYLWRRAGFALALSLCLLPAASHADDDVDELADKLERLERDLRQLEFDVYKGNPPPAGGMLPGAAIGGDGTRIGDLENSLRELRGQVETLTYQVRQLTEQLDLARKEANYRLGALEGGAPAGALPPAAAATAPRPTPSSVGGPTVSIPSKQPAEPTYGAPINLSPGVGSNTQAQKPGNLGSVPADAIPEAAAGGLSPRQQYDAAMDLLSRAQYAEAQNAFRGFVAAHPADELAGPAQYWVGDIAFTQKDYGGAAKAFAELLKRYAKTARAPDAMLKLGLSLLELGQKKEGCTTLAAVKSKYPNANKAILDRAAKRAAAPPCK
jgi:tol-pal system protein YbgF